MQAVSDGARSDLPLNLTVPWLEPEILVHHETHPGLFGIANNRLGLCEEWSQRLLANDMDAPPIRLGTDLLVR